MPPRLYDPFPDEPMRPAFRVQVLLHNTPDIAQPLNARL